MQPDLFLHAPRFDGETITDAVDGPRLHRQLADVKAWMLESGGWHTLAEIKRATGYPEASISARLRDLRKEKFGSYRVERRRVSGGLWTYRVSEGNG